MKRTYKKTSTSSSAKKTYTPAQKAYFAARKYIPKGTSATLGAAAGSAIAGPVGRAVGAAVGRQFAKLTGVGEYSIQNIPSNSSYRSSNSIMNPRTAFAPTFKSRTQDVVLTRSEYLCDIYTGTGTPTNFNLQNFNINPGLNYSKGGAFSWLSGIAPNFQEYRFEELVFEYRATSGESTGSNTALGSVIMAANYQATDPNYSNKAQMLDSQWSISGPPCDNILFPIECKNSEQQLKFHNIRAGPLGSNQNQDLFDMANFQIATIGCPTASQQIGELHVVYRVRLSKFQTSPINTLSNNAHYTGYVGSGAFCSNAHPLGTGGQTTSLVPRNSNQMTLTFDYNANTIFFPPLISSGIYCIMLNWKGSSTAVTSPTMTFSNCALTANIFNYQDSQATVVSNSGQTSGQLTFTMFVTVSAQNASFTITGVTLPTTCYSVDINIQEYNSLDNKVGQ